MYTKDHIYQFLKNNSPHYHYWIHYIIHIPIPNAFGFQLLICCNLKLDASRTHCLFLLTSMSFTKATKTHEISSSKFLCASVVAFPFCASYATTSCNLVVFFFFGGGVTFGVFLSPSLFVDSLVFVLSVGLPFATFLAVFRRVVYPFLFNMYGHVTIVFVPTDHTVCHTNVNMHQP